MKAIQAVQRGDQQLDLQPDWDDNEESSKSLPLPKDYFDLIGGTSTGGLVDSSSSCPQALTFIL